ILHHDNAPTHTSMHDRDCLAKNSINIILQAPYLPDQAPCDLFLFPRLELPPRGFESIGAIKGN
ncbi:hypothetical protein WH47_05361, partial [Habropoda laboriosa]